MDFNRRKSFRAQLTSLTEATVVVGKSSYSARVVDESAGGMMLALSSRLPVELHDTVQVRTKDAAFEMRVARIEPRGMGMRVGLERLKELPLPEAAAENTANSAKRLYRWSGPSLGPVVVLSILLVVATVMVAVLRQAPPTSRDMSLVARWLGQTAEAVDSQPTSVQLTSDARKNIRAEQGIGVLRLAEVIAELNLTDRQQAQLSELVQEERKLVEQQRQHGGQSDQLTRIQLEALSILNHQQRQKLENLLRQSVDTLQLVDEMARKHWPRANARQLLDRLGAAALTLPRVADQLHLSAEQAARISEIVRAALDQSEGIYQESRSSRTSLETQADTDQILRKALADSLQVLSPDQRQLLNDLPR